MRLGVLDVGSNTVHLLVVDAHRGGHPWPAHSEKSVIRLAEHLDDKGRVTAEGADALVAAVATARQAAEDNGVEEMLAFATSALRDAGNGKEVLARVKAETGVVLGVLSGEDEARLTFLAGRRWFGWSAGKLLLLDIGGGSLELAAGGDELPAVAMSLPLGAGRLTRNWGDDLDGLTEHVEKLLAPVVADLRTHGWDRAAATSKTFRSLARLAGAAPSRAGLWAPRTLTREGVHQVLAFIRRMDPAALAELDGVSPRRAHQLVAGAVVAEVAMRQLGVEKLDICPWALREGMILRWLDYA
ncbi:Ppx/GppA phosphatase family protein [Longispora urticae]